MPNEKLKSVEESNFYVLFEETCIINYKCIEVEIVTNGVTI